MFALVKKIQRCCWQRFRSCLLYPSLVLGSLGVLILLACDLWVSEQTAARLYTSTEGLKTIPARRVGLVLGTSPKNGDGSRNLFFQFRIQAAAELYHAGKIQYVLVSGDNRTRRYNEPIEMYHALVKHGVKAEHITLDYAGFRTLDSVVRAHAVFSESDFIVISQAFHNQRALFIGDYYGLDLLGYNAQDVYGAFQLKVRLREVLARFKAVLDLYVLGTQPHFFGDKVPVPTPLEPREVKLYEAAVGTPSTTQ